MANNQVNIIITAAINQFTSAMNQVQSTLQSTAEQMNGLSQRMRDIGGSMTASISAPVAGLGIAAVAAASQFDESLGRVQARLGLTKAEAEELNDVAKNVWKQGFGENVNEAADAVTVLKASLGDISNTELESATESAFMLQKAFDVDIREAAQTASSMVKNFGINSTQAFDLMAATMQATGDVSADALGTLWEYAPAFNEAGLEAKDMANMIVNGMSAGAISTDKLGDSINENMTRLTDESETSRAAITALGFDAETVESALSGGGEKAKGTFLALTASLANVKDQQEQNMIGQAIYGSMWEDTGKKAILAMTSGEDALGDVTGTALEAGKAIQDNFGTRLLKTWRGLQDALVPIGEVLISMIEKALPYIEQIVQKFTEWFGGLDSGEKKMYVIGAAIAAALGPALVVFGFVVKAVAMVVGSFAKFIGAVKKVWGWLTKLKAVFNLVRAAFLFLTGPIGGVIVIIGTLIGLAVLIYKNWSSVSAFLATIWEGIKNVASTVFFAIGNAIMTALSAAWSFIQSIFFAIGSFIVSALSATWNFIVEVFTNIVSTIAEQLTAAYNAVKAGFLFIVTAIGSAVTSAYERVKRGFLRIWEAIVSAVGNIKDTISKVFNFIKDFILQAVTNYYNNVKSNFELIKSTIATATGKAKDLAVKAFQMLKEGIATAIGLAWDTVTGFASDIIDTFTDIDLGEIGANIMAGLAKGISGAWGVVKKAAKKVATDLVDGFTDWLDMHSPSKVAEKKIGRMFGAGIAVGLEKSENPVLKAARSLAEKMQVEPEAMNLAPTMSATGFYSRSGTSLSSGRQTAVRTAGAADSGRVYQLDIPLTVDGREIARATARFTDEELKRMETSRQRAAGVIMR